MSVIRIINAANIFQNHTIKNHCKGKFYFIWHTSIMKPIICGYRGQTKKLWLCSGFIIVYLNSFVLFSFAFLFQWLLIQSVYNLPPKILIFNTCYFSYMPSCLSEVKRERGVYTTLKPFRKRLQHVVTLKGAWHFGMYLRNMMFQRVQ